MPDAKISALTSLTTATTDDLLAIVDDPGGSPVTKKITMNNFTASLPGRLWVPSSLMWPRTTTGCSALTKVETAVNKQNVQVLDFDQTTNEYAETTVVLPNWDGGTFTVTVYAFWNSAFFNTLWWAYARSYGAAEAIDQVFGTGQVATLAQLGVAANVVLSGTTAAVTPSGTPANNEVVQIAIMREATSASDDLPADARLLGIRINYTRALA